MATIEERRAAHAACMRAWRAKDPDHARGLQRRWVEANPQRMRAHRRKDYRRHTEQYKARAKAYRLANLERALERGRAWRAINRPAMDAYRAAWRERNPGLPKAMAAANTANRKAGLVNADGRLTALDVLNLWRRQPSCVVCGSGCGLDHTVPLSRGGTNTTGNLQNLCHSCNSSKGRKLPSEWAGRHVA